MMRFCYAVFFLVITNIAVADSAFAYIHHYLRHSTAYEVCRSTGMRLVRIDSESKHQQVMEFTKGLKNFSVYAAAFFISWKYDTTSSKFLDPDGNVNSLDKWTLGGPKFPSTRNCVIQFGPQNQQYGKWRTEDCKIGTPFICESGYPADPDIGMILTYPVTYETYLKVKADSSLTGCSPCLYVRGPEDSLLYTGLKEDIVELCTVRCTEDEMCTGITFSKNYDPTSTFQFCILLKALP